MKALLRLGVGATLGAALIAAAWALGWVEPPESVLRRVVIFSALYPAPRDGATLEPIACPPLAPARLFLVCTRNCEVISRVVLVRGLGVTLFIDQGRLPPVSESEARQRINTVIRAQRLRLDLEGARAMIACYLTLDGLDPEMVLPPGGVTSVEAARAEGSEAVSALADRLWQPDAPGRIEVRDAGDGFEATMLYWDRSREGWPILSLSLRLAPNGEVRSVEVGPAPSS